MPGGAKPGERRGGRTKGTPNKPTFEVIERLAKLGCDPFEGMAKIAMQQTECPTCLGSGVAKYVRYPDVGYVWEPDQGTERRCLACNGSGHEHIAPELRGRMFSELAQYVAPKRKAVEHTGDTANPVQYRLHVDVAQLTDAQLLALETLSKSPSPDKVGAGGGK